MAKSNSVFSKELSIGGVGLADRALFAKHLAVMLKSGVPITEALSTAADAASGKLKNTISTILVAVESGRPLSAAFSDHPKIFSGLFVQATYAGETSGTLVENLENVATQLEKEKELVTKIQGALLYPAIILVATFILGLAMAFLVLPKITLLFEGLHTKLPLTTRMLISFSQYIELHGTQLVIEILIGVGAFMWVVRQKFSRPVTNFMTLHTLIIKKMTRASNLARFSRTLGTLLKSGIGIGEALDITQNAVGNYYYQRAIGEAALRVSKGEKLAESLSDFGKLFPKIVTRMIKVGEESGRLEDTLFYLADFYEVEVDSSAKSLSTAIEPVLLLVIGLIVGGLALSIITPIYEITGNIHR
ncbi:MAG: type II secretion system F family protein [Patescibacteria group bacterium]